MPSIGSLTHCGHLNIFGGRDLEQSCVQFPPHLSLQLHFQGAMDVDDAVLAVKFNPRTDSLDISDSETDNAGLARLAAAVRGSTCLASLNLQRNLLTDLQPLLAVAHSLPLLASLNVSRNRLPCAALQALPATCMANLVSLDLCRNAIADKGAAAAAAFLTATGASGSLRVLRLRDNRIGHAGAAALAQALARPGVLLSELDLGANGVGDEGAEAMAFMLTDACALERLWLDMNGVGPVGGLALAAALAADSRLAFLSIVDNALGDAGVLALERAMATNGHLAEVRLRGNGSSLSHTAI